MVVEYDRGLCVHAGVFNVSHHKMIFLTADW